MFLSIAARCLLMLFAGVPCAAAGGPIIADHAAADISLVPESAVRTAVEKLHIAYGHTSHGSQIVTGMDGLVDFAGPLYSFGRGGGAGVLDLRDTPFTGARDLGNPDRVSWEKATRSYLDDNPVINVVVWSWCGQVSTADASDIETYLSLMSGLEEDYPGVTFVYMTGHLDGGGLSGNLHLRNEQIRDYCRANDKVLYDFADIESWDPDGVWYGARLPNDNCDYDTDGDGSRDGNWAVEWQTAHPGEWYACSAAHSQPLNANRKAYAAWWLWARLTGWDGGPVSVEEIDDPAAFSLDDPWPNPFNGAVRIGYELASAAHVELTIYSMTGQLIRRLAGEWTGRGRHVCVWNGRDGYGVQTASGPYICNLRIDGTAAASKRIMYIR